MYICSQICLSVFVKNYSGTRSFLLRSIGHYDLPAIHSEGEKGDNLALIHAESSVDLLQK